MMNEHCPVCSSHLRSKTESPAGTDATAYDCPRCGDFLLTGTLVASISNLLLRSPDATAKLSHAIRQSQEENASPILNTITAEAILKRPLPRPREQADLLIRWLAENVSGPGETLWVEFNTHGSIIGSKSTAGFELVLDHLFASGLVTGLQAKTIEGGDRAHATLSFEGWEYYERLKSGSAVYRKGFMAMKFGDTTLNEILEKVFRPSAKRAGFDLLKLDDVPKAGLIDDRLRVEIQSSDFLVADLTHDNLGAYWEAGYAEGLGKPVIYTCEKNKFESTKTHFDTNHHLTILWDMNAPELSGVHLTATIRSTLPHIARLSDE
jgi:hypothetical protein